jgi:hypothetical protein
VQLGLLENLLRIRVRGTDRVNAIWATVMGISTGIALAAVMRLLVESLDEHRSKGTSGPLVRTVLGVAALVIVFVVVLVRFQFVSS